jgi:DNA helicase HerA-like ATPase
MYLKDENKIWICKSGDEQICMIPKMANRHGLIAGATGTGKTVTLKVLAEAFSDMGVPVFMADIKGDVSGMCLPGQTSDGFQKRLTKLGIKDFSFSGYPVRFFDVYGKKGHPVRATISEMGPDLMSRLLELNDTQSGVMQIIFKIADDQGMLLLDLKDLRAMVQYVGDNSAQFTTKYGNVSSASVGAIQRGLLKLEQQGGDQFFGEPALDIHDWLVQDDKGRGMISILHCVELFQKPLLYSSFLLWMLSQLYDLMPEVGDLDKPKMVFFFDEAHLIFNDAPKALIDKVEQIVRLIRSKGVGVYFCTQLPSDIPDNVLGQLGNKFQHALRAYTPKDQKGLKAAAQSFRANPKLDTEKTLAELGTGEVLVSLLDAEGVPTMAERAYVMPPRSYLGVVDDATRAQMIASSPLAGKYNTPVDRESAYELLAKRASGAGAGATDGGDAELQKEFGTTTTKTAKEPKPVKEKPSEVDKMINTAVTTIGRDVVRNLSHQLVRSIFGIKRR